MAKFRFRLSTLLRLRENLRDDCRQQLIAAQRAEEIIAARIAALDEELAVLRLHSLVASRPGPVNVDRLLDSGRYEMMLKAERHAADEQRQAVVAEIDRRRQALVEADREVKSLEKLREQQMLRHRTEEARREMKRLDETAVQTVRGWEIE